MKDDDKYEEDVRRGALRMQAHALARVIAPTTARCATAHALSFGIVITIEVDKMLGGAK